MPMTDNSKISKQKKPAMYREKYSESYKSIKYLKKV